MSDTKETINTKAEQKEEEIVEKVEKKDIKN
jgi:hypothetical protein